MFPDTQNRNSGKRSGNAMKTRWLLTFWFICATAAANGVFTPWSPWTPCSVTCGWGQRQRYRGCRPSPNPAEDGWCKSGSYLQTEDCDSGKRCAVDGNWNSWSEWSFCSRSCGEGKQQRYRSCSSPFPQDGGRPCEGKPVETQQCFVRRQCPRDGNWSSWSQWSLCSVTCGRGGRKDRYRACNNPPPTAGGQECQGSGRETRECQALVNCPVNGQWSEWSEWSACSVTCARGERLRRRRCDSPPPLHGGEDCDHTEAAELQIESCIANVQFCPVNGGWSEWSDWGDCHSPECLSSRTPSRSFRERSCNAPMPRYKGAMCQGYFLEAGLCSNPTNCRVDGGWNEWSGWNCTRFVGTRRRICNNPPPSNGGRNCKGKEIEFHTRDEDEYSAICPQFPTDDEELIESSGHGTDDQEDDDGD